MTEGEALNAYIDAVTAYARASLTTLNALPLSSKLAMKHEIVAQADAMDALRKAGSNLARTMRGSHLVEA